MPNIVTGFCKEVVIFTAMQVNKNIKIFLNYFFGPLLFAWLAYSIYRQVAAQPQLEASWFTVTSSFNSYRIWYLITAILLIGANWGIEAAKWRLSIKSIHPLSFAACFKAVLSGVSFSVTMPNRVGEYLGRMMYLPEGSRLRTISATLVGSFAQLLITLMAGLAGLLSLRRHLMQPFPKLAAWYQVLLYGLVIVIFVLLLLYFNVESVAGMTRKWIRFEKYLYLVEALGHFNTALLARILGLSALRYLIFLIQYLLVFSLFGVEEPPSIVFAVMSVIFLAMAVIPSISLIEVGLRGEISIALMGVFTNNLLGVGLTSVTVWFINLIVPAMIGSILLLNMRIFRKKNERA
jgi:hypothetical protein